MAEGLANIIPLTSTTCKVAFIGYDSPKTDGLTQVTYNGSNFNVIQDGIENNGWCVVQASLADFDGLHRVMLGYNSNSPYPLPDNDSAKMIISPVTATTYAEAVQDQVGSNDWTAISVGDEPFFVEGAKKLAMADYNNQALKLDKADTDFQSDTQGEIIFVGGKYKYSRLMPVMSSGDLNSDNNFINNYVEAFSEGNAYQIRTITTGNNNRVVQDGTFLENQQLDYNVWGINSNGSQFKIFKNGVEQSTTTELGVNDGKWIWHDPDMTRLGINGLFRNTNFLGRMNFKFLYYSSRPLTTEERQQVVDYANYNCFGSTTPTHHTIQNLVPNQRFQNSRYNYTGTFAKKSTGLIAASYDAGATHYNEGVGDFHDVLVQFSNDNGVTFGTPKLVYEGSDPNSYSNNIVYYDSTGRLHCLAAESQPDAGGGTTYSGVVTKYSDDDGDTWSSKVYVSGLIEPINSIYGNMLEQSNGNLIACGYGFEIGGIARIYLIRSTDNGVSWSFYRTIDQSVWADGGSNFPLNEISMAYVGDGVLFTSTRVNGREFYFYNISYDDGDTWERLVANTLGDWWQNDNVTNTSSNFVHPIRMNTFTYKGELMVAAIYLNRGLAAQKAIPTYLSLVCAKASDLVNHGSEGWDFNAGIRMHINGIDLTNLDGYMDILFPDNNNRMLIRAFKDTNGTPYTINLQQGTVTDIYYTEYTIPTHYLDTLVN